MTVMDDLQQINWHAIARFLTERNYSGHVIHELTPSGDVLQAFRHAPFSILTREVPRLQAMLDCCYDRGVR